MAMIKRGGRAWQLLTVAVIAVPWLLRDELATRLDTEASAAAEVQTALHQESDRASQAAEQRETRDRLHRIEILLAKATKETSAAEAEEAKAGVATGSALHEAEELVNSAHNFMVLLDRIAITPQPVSQDDIEDRKPLDKWLGIDSIAAGGLTQPQLQALAEKVAKTAQDVADSDDPAVGDWTEWNSATNALHVAYSDLAASAEAAEQSSAGAANTARWAAWFFTALGALMIGDWSRVVRGRDADAGAGDSANPEPEAGDFRKAA